MKNLNATTGDLGLAIRDFIEGQDMSVFVNDEERAGERKIDCVDASVSSDLVVYLDNGQTFVVRIFARN